MTILVVYSQEPPFPATDQNPDAVRYHVGIYWADCLGDEPTPEMVQTFLNPTDFAQSNGVALAERQRKTAKDEAAALASAGDFKAALERVLDLL